MRRIKKNAPQLGFTVTELLIVISIMAIMASIATVAISDSVRRARLKEATRAVEGDLNRIRTMVRVNQVSNVVTIVTTTGVIAFRDNNGNQVFDAGDTKMLDDFFTTPGLVTAVTSTPAVASPGTILYNTIGGVTGDATRKITFSLSTDPTRLYQITLYQTGITQVAKSEDSGTTWMEHAW